MITTIMFNYVATLFMGYLYTTALREGSVPQTAPVPEATQIGRIFPDLRITWGIVVALLLGVAIWYFLFYTSKGFQLRAVGSIPLPAAKRPLRQAQYARGFHRFRRDRRARRRLRHPRTQFPSSALRRRLRVYGVALALIAQLHPLATVAVAYFFAVLARRLHDHAGWHRRTQERNRHYSALVIIFAVAGSSMLYLPKVRKFLNNLFEKKEKEAASL
jgi:simple sugar transport system permease protein